MDEIDLREAVTSAGISNLGLVISGPKWGKSALALGIEGTMLVAGDPIRVRIGLPSDFPDRLPRVFVLAESARDLAHVDEHGDLCVVEGENALHDHRREQDLVREVLARARRVLEDGLLGRNAEDFLNEAEAYWVAKVTVHCVVAANEEARRVCAAYSSDTLVAVGDTADQIESVLRARTRTLPALYLPLDPTRTRHAHPRRLAAGVPGFFNELSEGSMALLRKTKVGKKESLLVVLGIPRPAGGRALVGLLLKKFERDSTLADARSRTAQPVSFERYDDEHLRQRGATTRPGRVVLVGCGAVGGHIAHALAWMGASELVLIDPDTYNGGNTFRHVLGRSGWSSASKVSGLKAQLAGLLPELRIIAIKDTIGTAFASRLNLLLGADILVVAIGNQSVPLRLNDELSEQRFRVPVVYTWLEPYGIGGHALLVRYGSPGCLRCLFEDDPDLHNTRDFAAPGQTFARRELGCHGLFTPYADLDARETAVGAVRLVERSFRDPSAPAWLRSWRGDATAFRQAGYRTVANYDELPRGFEAALEPRKGCPTCDRR